MKSKEKWLVLYQKVHLNHNKPTVMRLNYWIQTNLLKQIIETLSSYVTRGKNGDPLPMGAERRSQFLSLWNILPPTVAS